MSVRDFVDVVYAYATNNHEGRTLGRKAFTEYIFDLRPSGSTSPDQPFEQAALSLIDELDSFEI